MPRSKGRGQQTAPFPFIFVSSRRIVARPSTRNFAFLELSNASRFWTRCIQNPNSTLITCTRPFHPAYPIRARRSRCRSRTPNQARLKPGIPEGTHVNALRRSERFASSRRKFIRTTRMALSCSFTGAKKRISCHLRARARASRYHFHEGCLRRYVDLIVSVIYEWQFKTRTPNATGLH